MRIFQYVKLIAYTVILICSSSLLTAQTTYVKTGGTGAGTSWVDAAGDLSLVLAQAQSGDEIWVAEGTYLPISCTSCGSGERAFTFQIPSGVRLYGGFNGTETLLSQRMTSTQITTLSGDIDSDGQQDNNSYHVVTFDEVDAQTRLDGFTITDGFANGANGRQNGGGILVDGADTPNSCTPHLQPKL